MLVRSVASAVRVVCPCQYTIKRMSVSQTSAAPAAAGKMPEEKGDFAHITVPVPWGGYLAGKAWGKPGTGTPVLALHGWLNNAGTFDTLAPLLAKDLYIVAFDLPGHGQSSHRPVGCHYHFVDYVQDIKTVVRELGWEKFSFLCHSMSAGVATMFAAAQPNLVKNMVLIENIGVMSRPLEDLPKLMGQTLDTPPIAEDTTKVYGNWDEIVSRFLEGNGRGDPQLTREGAECIAIRGTNSVEGGYRYSHDMRVRSSSLLYIPHEVNKEFLKSIACPTLLIMGKETFMRTESMNRRLQHTPPDKVKVVQVSGGHHLHLYKHHEIAPLVKTFLLSSTVHPQYQELSKL